MMMFIEQNEELNVLRAQMDILKKHIAENEVISQEMLDATMKANVKNLTSKQVYYLLGIALDIVVSLFIMYIYFQGGTCSLVFMIATVAWGLFWAFINYQQYKLNVRKQLLDGVLIDTAEEVMKWKQLNMKQGVMGAVASVIWCSICLYEIWGDISQNPLHAVFVGLIFVVVFGTTANRWLKVHKVTSELLKQIAEMR